MSNQSYSTSKGRRKSPSFTMLRHDVMDSANYLMLSNRAARLLTDVCRQYNGRNNADLCVTFSVMKKRGWRSKDQLAKSILELEHFGFLIKSRQGGRHKCSLYALTFLPVDECGGKHDLPASKTPSNNWKVEKKPYRKKIESLPRSTGNPAPQYGAINGTQLTVVPRSTGQSGVKS